MARGRHPSKDVEQAVQYAEQRGFVHVTAGRSSHAWVYLRCPGDCPQVSVWATPRGPGSHAIEIVRAVNRCRCEEQA